MNKLLLLILICFSPVTLLAQDYQKLLDDVFETFIPKKYTYTLSSECFHDSRIFASALSCMDYQVESNDKEVIVYVEFRPSDQVKRTYYDTNPDHMHRFAIRENLSWTLLKHRLSITKEDRDENITYYSSEYAKEVYNADSVFTYYFWPKEVSIFRDKYVGSQAILGQKNGKGFFVVYCFYTEKAKKNLDKYLKGIEGFIKFREEDKQI